MRQPPCRPERGRFAPSPSGRMHLGNVFSCLLAWLDARSIGGGLILRMEDLDPDRCRREYALRLADDLQWLGLGWDAGWDGTPAGDAYAQSTRTPYYDEAFDALRRRGLVYPCYCSRAQRLAAAAPHQPGEGREAACRCRSLAPAQRLVLEEEGRRPAWRIAVPDETMSFTDGCRGPYSEALARDTGDFILRRSDGIYAYQLAVSVDDGLMGVTRVVRGRDLLPSTARQIWLHRQLGFEPPRYFHLPLLLAPDGRRLSKREQDLDMGALRCRYTPTELVGLLGHLAGLCDTPAPVSPRELAGVFRWEDVTRQDITVPADLR